MLPMLCMKQMANLHHIRRTRIDLTLTWITRFLPRSSNALAALLLESSQSCTKSEPAPTSLPRLPLENLG